jgi:hypothetical protein
LEEKICTREKKKGTYFGKDKYRYAEGEKEKNRGKAKKILKICIKGKENRGYM